MQVQFLNHVFFLHLIGGGKVGKYVWNSLCEILEELAYVHMGINVYVYILK